MHHHAWLNKGFLKRKTGLCYVAQAGLEHAAMLLPQQFLSTEITGRQHHALKGVFPVHIKQLCAQAVLDTRVLSCVTFKSNDHEDKRNQHM